MRLIILAGLIYLLYRAVKNWTMIGVRSVRKEPFSKPNDPVDDLMAKDPFCGVFFPKSEGIRVRVNGEELIFCSEGCRDKYLKQDTKPKVS